MPALFQSDTFVWPATGPVDANGQRHVLVLGYDAAVHTYPARIETREAGHTQHA